MLTGVDIAIIAIIVVSSLISLMRGFVKEAISLLTWSLAFWVAVNFSTSMEMLLPESIRVPSLRLALSFAALFFMSLLVGGLVNYFISSLVDQTGLNGTDRTLGMVFGIMRGSLIVAILVLLAGLTPLPQDPWWQEAQLIKHFELLAGWLKEYIPQQVANNFVHT